MDHSISHKIASVRFKFEGGSIRTYQWNSQITFNRSQEIFHGVRKGLDEIVYLQI